MAEPYRVLGATEQLFKASSKAADYHITEKERKNDQVQVAEDGEEIGHSLNPDSVWHHSTSATFSIHVLVANIHSLQTPSHIQHLVPRHHASPLPHQRPDTLLRARALP